MQYVVVLVTVVAILIVRRAPYRAMLFGIPLAANLVVVAPYYWPTGGQSDPVGETLRAVFFNVNTANQRYADTIAFLDQVNADLVLLEEVDESWLAGLKTLESRYPYSIAVAR